MDFKEAITRDYAFAHLRDETVYLIKDETLFCLSDLELGQKWFDLENFTENGNLIGADNGLFDIVSISNDYEGKCVLWKGGTSLIEAEIRKVVETAYDNMSEDLYVYFDIVRTIENFDLENTYNFETQKRKIRYEFVARLHEMCIDAEFIDDGEYGVRVIGRFFDFNIYPKDSTLKITSIEQYNEEGKCINKLDFK